jgi:penicillin-binding protein 1A
MGKVTGGSAPAQIWRDFMSKSLPRLQVKAIPDGPADLPFINDPIGDLLAQGDLGDIFGDALPTDPAPYAGTSDIAPTTPPPVFQPSAPPPQPQPAPTLTPEAQAAWTS